MLSLFVRTIASIAIVFAAPARAQFIRQHDATNTRSFHGGTKSIERSFASDAEAAGTFKQILEAAGLMGLEDRIFLRASANTPNAAAFIETSNDGEKRYIAYNVNYMQQLKIKTQNYWSLVAVLAHEIGHYVRFHTVISGRNHEFELEADYQAGFILRRMGATQNETVAAFNTFPENSSPTHPGRKDRIQAATLGWLKAGPAIVPRAQPPAKNSDNELLRAAGSDYSDLVESVKVRFESFDGSSSSQFTGIPHLVFSFTNLSPKTANITGSMGCNFVRWKYRQNGRVLQLSKTATLNQNGSSTIRVPAQTTKKISYSVDLLDPPAFGSQDSAGSVCKFWVGFGSSAMLYEVTSLADLK